MAQLIVRKVDEGLVRRLKMRAAANGRSAEAEVRAILEQVLPEAKEDWMAEAARFQAETAGRKMASSLTLLRAARRRGT